jgi:hypothetical protein
MIANEMQHIFLGNVARLIIWMQDYYKDNWVVGGELWRTPEQAKRNSEKGIGSGNSLHLSRLAIDIPMVDREKKTIVASSSFYAPAGAYWKSLHPLNRWGGDIPNDGNHFSMSPDGRI